ncbi:MAG: urea carboxylase-associated family protein [Daejeonella sp.]
MQELQIIPPRSGVSFILKKGQRLKVVDIQGEQVSDFISYNLHDKSEYLSSGRTIDYAETIFLTKGHPFYSNRSNIMFEIVEDTVGRHDFLLTPCSADTFRIIYGHEKPHRGCFGNLAAALKEFDIAPDDIPISFNIFMNVEVDGTSGQVSVLPPKSKAGDYIVIEAKMDLIVGLTACSAEMSNNYSFKPIGYIIEE